MTSHTRISAMVTKTKKKRAYFREIKQEIQKVSWTSKSELFMLTKVILGATFFLGVGIYLIDLILRLSLETIGWLARLIGG